MVGVLRVVTESEVESLLGFADLPLALDLVEQAYRLKAQGQVAFHPRLTLQYPPETGYYDGSAVRLMAGIIPAMGAAAMRIYSIYHAAPVVEMGPRGLDYLMRDEVLLYWRHDRDMELAAMLADRRMMNVRTAAPTGVATRWLAAQDARVLGVIGAGRHAPWQIAAVCAARSIEQVNVFSPTREHREQVARMAGEVVSADVRAVNSAQEAVSEADVVVTVTNANRPVIDARWLKRGAHVNVIARGESDEQTLLEAGVIACSSREQILHDVPDFRPVTDLIRRGLLSEDRFVDLEQVLVDHGHGRQSAEERTVFLSQGNGLWDTAIASLVYQRAVNRRVGREVSLL